MALRLLTRVQPSPKRDECRCRQATARSGHPTLPQRSRGAPTAIDAGAGDLRRSPPRAAKPGQERAHLLIDGLVVDAADEGAAQVAAAVVEVGERNLAGEAEGVEESGAGKDDRVVDAVLGREGLEPLSGGLVGEKAEEREVAATPPAPGVRSAREKFEAAPVRIPVSGELVDGLRWRDASGERALLLAQDADRDDLDGFSYSHELTALVLAVEFDDEPLLLLRDVLSPRRCDWHPWACRPGCILAWTR